MTGAYGRLAPNWTSARRRARQCRCRRGGHSVPSETQACLRSSDSATLALLAWRAFIEDPEKFAQPQDPANDISRDLYLPLHTRNTHKGAFIVAKR